MNLPTLSSALVLLVGAALPAFAVAPQRTFVSIYGSDTNSCSVTAPCRAFQAAIDAVAPGGEVVAMDSGGYGAMEIHKSVSVIVPSGVHAGLSPATGIPLPGFPGDSTVVLIDIQDSDIVVLRGLNINQQGSVTGGIDWVSAAGGTLHVENVTVNGFPFEGIYMGATGGRMFVNDSILRNNGYGIYVRSASALSDLAVNNVRIENSGTGIVQEGYVHGALRDVTIQGNTTGVYVVSGTQPNFLRVHQCSVINNGVAFKLENAAPQSSGFPYLILMASVVLDNGQQLQAIGVNVQETYGNNMFDSAGFTFNHVSLQ